MISHIFVGTNDRERATAFYAAVLSGLGWRRRHSDSTPHLALWQPAESTRPLFGLGAPFNGEAAVPGNGGMIALMANDRATVDRVFSIALTSGAVSEGEPGLRPHYHANYYGAYFRDLDGNKMCVVCHQPADAS
jgi:catechol 2,3-dioxygenase-like lactoylglutathione lyase family enzyme